MKLLHPTVLGLAILLVSSCDTGPADKRIKQFDPQESARLAREIESLVTPQLAEGFTIRLWGTDSLVADPVSIDIDDQGRLYYTRTNRQKHTEFDIRNHQDWEIASVSLRSIEEKREFLRRVLAPANSDKNKWLADLNNDGSHDWRDMTVEKEHVYRMEDIDGDGVADLSQLVIEDFNDEVSDAAGGVLKHGDDLFVAIGPDLWLVKDKNNDGLADEKVSLSHGYGVRIGFSGHGMSGIEVGPEGKIYWQIGDIGFNGTGPDGTKWEHPNSGVVVRANPDGSDFEVFAYGNRNTHEFVFDEYGNMISEDNDGDHRGERERLVYIVNGADIGWRANWQYGKYRDPENNTYKVWMDERLHVPHFEGQAAYITPPIANFVNGPTGMLYNPGTALSEEWNNTFFIVEFTGSPARSGVHAFKLNPKGATFELGETKRILGGVLATGLDWGPDGAMYVGDWIDGWGTKDFGRIWKLDVENANRAEREAVKTLIMDDFTSYVTDDLGELLMHKDMRVRQKAQFELATRGEKGMAMFEKMLAQREHQLARVHSIWGISQFARKELKRAAVLVPVLDDEDPEIRAQAAKWIGDVRYPDAGDKLIAMLNDDYPRARFFAAEALGRTKYKPAVQGLIDLLERNNDEDTYIRHAASLALARIGDANAVSALTTHPSRAVRIGAVVALRRMGDPGIAGFLNDKDELVVTEAARGINDDLSIEAALPALANALRNTSWTNEAFVRRAISANLRVGTEETMKNLLDYAANESNPVVLRAEAIAALSTWPKPSVLDRVDGRFRGEITRDPAPVRAASTPVLVKLLSYKEPAIRIAAVKAIGKLKIADASAPLFARLTSDSSPEVRVEAVKALVAVEDKETGRAIDLALRDKDKLVRVTGLDLLPETAIAKGEMVHLISRVIREGSMDEKQAALTTLGSLPVDDSSPLLNELLDQMERKQLTAEINLELESAIDSTRSVELKGRYKTILAKNYADTLMAQYAGALYGGNPEAGQRIVFNHITAQCVRCHSYNDMGGNAGPSLNGVASRLSREELLQALITPSSRLAPGYGMVTFDLKNGKKVSGILLEETSDAVSMKIGDKPDTTIMVSDITSRSQAMSSMPPMGPILTKKQIRDVVSWLGTLQ